MRSGCVGLIVEVGGSGREAEGEGEERRGYLQDRCLVFRFSGFGRKCLAALPTTRSKMRRVPTFNCCQLHPPEIPRTEIPRRGLGNIAIDKHACCQAQPFFIVYCESLVLERHVHPILRICVGVLGIIHRSWPSLSFSSTHFKSVGRSDLLTPLVHFVVFTREHEFCSAQVVCVIVSSEGSQEESMWVKRVENDYIEAVDRRLRCGARESVAADAVDHAATPEVCHVRSITGFPHGAITAVKAVGSARRVR